MNLLVIIFLFNSEAKAYGFGAIAAIFILAYLIYSLIHPEKL